MLCDLIKMTLLPINALIECTYRSRESAIYKIAWCVCVLALHNIERERCVPRTCFWTKMAVWCVLQTCIWPRCRTRPCATKWAPRCTEASTRAAAPTASTGRPAVPRWPTRGTSSTTRPGTLTAGPDNERPSIPHKVRFLSSPGKCACALCKWHETKKRALCDACDDFFYILRIDRLCLIVDFYGFIFSYQVILYRSKCKTLIWV